MLDTRTVLACVMASGASAIALAILERCSASLGLIDRPDTRKHHVGEVPLVGGLSMFIGLSVGALWLGNFGHFVHMLLATAAVLTLLGAFDDRYDLSVRTRLLVQTLAILVVIATTGVYIHSLGHVLGHDLALNWLGVPFTVVAVIGLLNAFNMMDGIDGLVGSLSLVSIGAILLYANGNGTRIQGAAALMLLMGAALLPYLTANLGLVGRKVFLGDAGSMALGYLFAWTLIDLSQTAPSRISPIDVLWCVALPVLDTLAVMYRRLRQGKSPFKPDRGHIHHIIMGTGVGARSTLAYLIALALALALFGSVVRLFGTAINLATFSALVVTYTLMATRMWTQQQEKRKDMTGMKAANDANIATPAPRRGTRTAFLGKSRNVPND